MGWTPGFDTQEGMLLLWEAESKLVLQGDKDGRWEANVAEVDGGTSGT